MFVSCVRASGRGESVWACDIGVLVDADPHNGELPILQPWLRFGSFGAIGMVFVLVSLMIS